MAPRPRKILTPEQIRADYLSAVRSDLRRFKAARDGWIASAKSHGATDEVAANTKPVLELDRLIAEAEAELA